MESFRKVRSFLDHIKTVAIVEELALPKRHHLQPMDKVIVNGTRHVL